MMDSSEVSAQLDSLQLAEAVRSRLVDFCADGNFSRSPQLTDICRRFWSGDPSQGGLISELWVEGAFPAKRSTLTLEDLVRADSFHADLCRHLDKSGAVPAGRPLYQHQEQAIRFARERGAGGERPTLVVSAGTGAGKTECFLLPVLDDLFTDPPRGTGIKCLILYPMNALVNDQVDRLYQWLRGQTQVRLFHFTSETPETYKSANSDRVPEWDECRFRTRQQARGLETRDGKACENGPIPDILITNYSMLEYMLCRPQDAVFFGDALRAIVLDEAHLYTGTLAAEITLLLRRVYERCGVSSDRILQFGTSATLGVGETDELRDFAGQLFSKASSRVRVIVGESARASLASPIPPGEDLTVARLNTTKMVGRSLLVSDATGSVKLVRSTALCEELRAQLPVLSSVVAPKAEDRPAPLLYDALAHAPVMHKLEEVLWNRRHLPLRALAAELWGDEGPDAQKATITVLQLASSARLNEDAYPLVPHRIHLLARSADNLTVCLNEECDGPLEVRMPGFGSVAAGIHEQCPQCRAAMLAIYRCNNCGEVALGGVLDGVRYRPTPATRQTPTFFSKSSGSDKGNTEVTLSVRTGERSGAGAAGIRLTEVNECACGATPSEQFRPIGSSEQLTLAVLAETVLTELPPYPAPHNPFLPARGRRLLAFSDSRRQAARLGPQLTRQHEIQLVRAAIVRSLSDNPAADPETIQALRSEVAERESALSQAGTPALRQLYQRKLAEALKDLKNFEAGGPIHEWAIAVGNSSICEELFDAETGQRHEVFKDSSDKQDREWSQFDWDANKREVGKRAIHLLAREFATPNWRAISVETIGMGEITYPGLNELAAPVELMARLPSDRVRAAVGECWVPLLHALCDTLRAEGAITLGSRDADFEHQPGGVPVGRWAAKEVDGPALARFIGDTPRQSRRRFVAGVLATTGLAENDAAELARDVLEWVFQQLVTNVDRFAWLKKSQRQARTGAPVEAIRLCFGELGLRRPPELYQCIKTGHVWPRSVAACAPEMGCQQTLRRVSDEDLDRDSRLGRLRREYRQSPVFELGLWAEEHSAQLNPKESRRLQDLFKAGIRNVLSATTTLELGIDIGGLTAALLSNVPPGKANYLQRAGRTGRRTDGSAAVITFARQSPFDREVFRHFGSYLSKPLRKPRVFLDRTRIVWRHLNAYLLGEFFRAQNKPGEFKGAMDAFGRMGRFCGKPTVPYWDRGNSPPRLTDETLSLEEKFLNWLARLKDFSDRRVQSAIEQLFENTGLTDQAQQWESLIAHTIKEFQNAIRDWNSDFELLRQSWSDAVETGNRAQANAIRYQLSVLSELTVIEALADRQFLPSYGFPIGLQKLRVIAPDERRPNRFREEDQFRLERPGILAMADYVPGSQILAAGKLVTSRGLLKHWTGATIDSSLGLRGQLGQCQNGHSFYWIAGEKFGCPVCDGQDARPPQDLLFTKYGFTTAAWDAPKWSTDIERIGQAETICITFRPNSNRDAIAAIMDFAQIPGLVADYREKGELLVFNRGENGRGFAVCLRCGYAESEKKSGKGRGNMDLPSNFLHHAPIQATDESKACLQKANASPPLRYQILAARETTDALLLDFSGTLGVRAHEESLMLTLAYALQSAGARLLELDSRELGVLLVPTGPSGAARGPVIYDNSPGGAGHVRELLAYGSEWFETAKRVLFVNAEHHRSCESGCLDCLLTYDTQRVLFDKTFARKAAYQCLAELLET